MKIRCDKSKIDGYGVFATEKISCGEIIEQCPIISFGIKELITIKHTKILNYLFEWDLNSNEKVALVLGYGPIYNHSQNANAKNHKDFKNKYMIFYAIKDIEKGEEILINYHGDPNCKEPVWFEVRS